MEEVNGQLIIQLETEDRISQYIYQGGAVYTVNLKTPQLVVSLFNRARNGVLNRAFII